MEILGVPGSGPGSLIAAMTWAGFVKKPEFERVTETQAVRAVAVIWPLAEMVTEPWAVVVTVARALV